MFGLRRALTLPCLLGTALAVSSGCSADADPPRGQLIVAFQTDMNVPKDITTIRVIVTARGEVRHNVAYGLKPGPNGDAELPATLAIVAGNDPSVPVTVRVVASGPGAAGPSGDGKSRVLREATTTVPSDRFALLHMPLQWLCWTDVVQTETDGIISYSDSCSDKGQTCVSGECRDPVIDSNALPSFDNALLYGGGQSPNHSLAQCIDVLGCFAQGSQVTPDLSDCSVALPGGSAEGVNVGLVLPADSQGICGPEACIVVLDQDSVLGWREENGRARLPTAACALLGDTVDAIAVTSACATKTTSVPTCGAWSAISGQYSEDGGAPSVLDGGEDGSLDGGQDAEAPCVGQQEGLACGGGPTATLYVCEGGVEVSQSPCPFGCVEMGGTAYCDGDPTTPVSPLFGGPCVSDTDCGGLSCLTAAMLPGGAGPSGGLCTVPCSPLTDTCVHVGAGAACREFAPGIAFCVEGCSLTASPKCGDRSDMACEPTLDLGSGLPRTACSPVCSDPFTCDLAVPGPEPTTGACHLDLGFCGPFGAPSPNVGADCSSAACSSSVCASIGTDLACAGTCKLEELCAYDTTALLGVSACLWPKDPQNIAVGNAGQCMQLCNCQEGCDHPNFECVQFPAWLTPGKDQTYGSFGGDGYCAPAIDATGAATVPIGC